MRKSLLTLVATLFALPVLAENDITQSKQWDADSSTFTYCVELGKSANTSGGTSRGGDYITPRTAAYKVKTSGSSITIVSNTASSGALKYVSVGDIISFIVDGARVERVVVTNADDNTITVEEAIDLSDGIYYSWRTQSCGTTGISGEIPVRDLKFFQLTVQVAQMTVDAGGVDLAIECRHRYGPFMVIEEKNVTTGGAGVNSFLTRFFHEERWEACRVGVQVDDDDAVDTGADAEKVTIFLSGDGVGQE